MLAFSVNIVARAKKNSFFFSCTVVPSSCYLVRRKEWLYNFNAEVFLLHSAYVDVVLSKVLSIILKFIFVWILVIGNSSITLEMLLELLRGIDDKMEMWCCSQNYGQTLGSSLHLNLCISAVEIWNHIQNC